MYYLPDIGKGLHHGKKELLSWKDLWYLHGTGWQWIQMHHRLKKMQASSFVKESFSLSFYLSFTCLHMFPIFYSKQRYGRTLYLLSKELLGIEWRKNICTESALKMGWVGMQGWCNEVIFGNAIYLWSYFFNNEQYGTYGCQKRSWDLNIYSVLWQLVVLRWKNFQKITMLIV